MKAKATRRNEYDWRAELQKTVEAAADCSDTPEDFISFMEACGYEVDCGTRRLNLQFTTPCETECNNIELLLSDYARYKIDKIFNTRRGCEDCPRQHYFQEESI